MILGKTLDDKRLNEGLRNKDFRLVRFNPPILRKDGSLFMTLEAEFQEVNYDGKIYSSFETWLYLDSVKLLETSYCELVELYHEG